ncbi:MAG: phage tail sheath family protein [Deltaproteobacteria bacterium]|nr:phage tail sheath family protein [Deltaproteobacteria bacterium]
MPEYLAPGVYVEEVSSGVKPIESVSTSNAGFVGVARKGPIGEAKLVTNWGQFVKEFGGFYSNYNLGYSVRQFFDEGGARAYISRVVHFDFDGTTGTTTAQASTATLCGFLHVEAISPGSWGDNLYVTAVDVDFRDDLGQILFRLEIHDGPVTEDKVNLVETIEELSVDEFTPEGQKNKYYVIDKVNAQSKFIQIPENGVVSDPPLSPPFCDAVQLTAGNDGLADLIANDYIGIQTLQTGLYAFDKVDEVNIIAVPAENTFVEDDINPITIEGLNYCGNRKDCFYVAEMPKQLENDVQEMQRFRSTFNSTYGAIYTPWLKIRDPLTGLLKEMPPSGAVVGTYANTDINRGVHKAPAGLTDGFLDTASNVRTRFTKGEQDILNPDAINVIRKFDNGGIVIWGARTLSRDSEWRYINVRRLFLMLEESIEEATQWVVFEPNDPSLWARIRRNISAFLQIQWDIGALVGNTAEEAFKVKCDAETNPPEIVDAGQVITEIGVAPSKPAEFVIFRISQSLNGSSVTE